MKKYNKPEMRIAQFHRDNVLTLSGLKTKGVELVNQNEIPTDAKSFDVIRTIFS